MLSLLDLHLGALEDPFDAIRAILHRNQSDQQDPEVPRQPL